MAINFLNTVDLNSIQIENIVPENANAGTIGAGVLGQMYFDTAQDTMMQYVADSDGAGNPGYIEIGTTSGVETFSNTNVGSTYVDFSVVNASAIGDVNIGFADLNAVDGTSTAADRFFTKANKWATIPFGDITAVLAGTYINVDNSTGPEPTINHDLTTRTDTTSTASPAYGATFTTIDTVTTNTTGHVTALNVKTITLPADTNETYTLPTTSGVVAPGAPTTGIISLTAGGTGSGVKNTVTFTGTTGRIDVAGSTTGIAGAITIDLTDDVIIVDDLTVGGVITQSQTLETNSFASELDMNNTKLLNVKTGTAGTDGVNLGQVESLVAGLGSFQGGYDATNNPGTPALTGSSNVAIGNGDFYVVTAPGVITFSDTPTGDATLEVGDFIFANTNIAINSNPPSTSFTLVIADANIAGVGATDGATAKGVSGFDSAHFTATVNGWIQLKERTNPNGRKQSLNNTAPSSRAEAGGVTTFTLDLANSILFDTGALSEDVAIEVTEGAAPYETVYAHVNRSGSASMTVAFTGSVANDAYQVLLTYVG